MTKEGLKTAQKYKVDFVPTIVTIHSGKVKNVYVKDKSEKIILNEKAIYEVFKE